MAGKQRQEPLIVRHHFAETTDTERALAGLRILLGLPPANPTPRIRRIPNRPAGKEAQKQPLCAQTSPTKHA